MPYLKEGFVSLNPKIAEALWGALLSIYSQNFFPAVEIEGDPHVTIWTHQPDNPNYHEGRRSKILVRVSAQPTHVVVQAIQEYCNVDPKVEPAVIEEHGPSFTRLAIYPD